MLNFFILSHLRHLTQVFQTSVKCNLCKIFYQVTKKMQKMKFQRSLAAETIIDAQSIPSAQTSAGFPKKIYSSLNGEVFTQTSHQVLKDPHVKEVLQKTSRLVK